METFWTHGVLKCSNVLPTWHLFGRCTRGASVLFYASELYGLAQKLPITPVLIICQIILKFCVNVWADATYIYICSDIYSHALGWMWKTELCEHFCSWAPEENFDLGVPYWDCWKAPVPGCDVYSSVVVIPIHMYVYIVLTCTTQESEEPFCQNRSQIIHLL